MNLTSFNDETLFAVNGFQLPIPRLPAAARILEQLVSRNDEPVHGDTSEFMYHYMGLVTYTYLAHGQAAHAVASDANLAQDWYQHVGRFCPNNVILQAPSFSDYWPDIVDSYPPVANPKWLTRCGVYRGKPMMRADAYVYEVLIQSGTPQVRQWLVASLNDQPVMDITCPSIDVLDNVTDEAYQLAVSDFLREPLESGDRFQVYQSLAFLGTICQTVCDLIENRLAERFDNVQDIRANLESYVAWVSLPTSVWDLSLRRRLAAIETPYLLWLRALVFKAKKFRTQGVPANELCWYIMNEVMICVEQAIPVAADDEEALEICGHISDALQLDLDWDDSFSRMEPVANFRPLPTYDPLVTWVPMSVMTLHTWIDHRLNCAPQTVDLGRYFAPILLPPVEFRAIGPRLNITDYAHPTQTPANAECSICLLEFEANDSDPQVIMELPCSHSFHEDCLDNLINDPDQYSNLCPNCRHRICEPRPREAIVDQ